MTFSSRKLNGRFVFFQRRISRLFCGRLLPHASPGSAQCSIFQLQVQRAIFALGARLSQGNTSDKQQDRIQLPGILRTDRDASHAGNAAAAVHLCGIAGINRPDRTSLCACTTSGASFPSPRDKPCPAGFFIGVVAGKIRPVYPAGLDLLLQSFRKCGELKAVGCIRPSCRILSKDRVLGNRCDAGDHPKARLLRQILQFDQRVLISPIAVDAN